MPIPHIPEQTTFIEAGAVTFGVEHRVLNYNIVADYMGKEKAGVYKELDDGGLSIHVYGTQGKDLVEYLRFDCFEKSPHYHYIFPQPGVKALRYPMDPVAEADIIGWTIERLRTRLVPMLVRAGAEELARKVDPRAIEAALPRLEKAIDRVMRQGQAASQPS